MPGGDDPALPFERAELDRLPQGFDLDDLAGRGDVVKLRAANRRDPIAPLGFALNEAVGHQSRQRLTERACAHAVALAQMLDPQLLLWRQRAADDVVAQASISALDLTARRRVLRQRGQCVSSVHYRDRPR